MRRGKGGLIAMKKTKTKERPLTKDPVTDEILIPWGTMMDQLKELGLINENDREVTKNG
jgi:hypothetical protein